MIQALNKRHHLNAVPGCADGAAACASGAAVKRRTPFAPRFGGLPTGVASQIPPELLAAATVSGSKNSDPPLDLYHQLAAGKHLIFMPNDQYSRAANVVCVSAQIAQDAPDVGRVRLITWSSANGWLELYPEDGSPMARDKNGKVVPYDEDAPGKQVTSFNDDHLIDELYPYVMDPQTGRPKSSREPPNVIDPLTTLRQIGGFRPAKENAPKQKEGELVKKDRIIFLMNGMGPALRISAGDSGDGALLQALREMKARLETDTQDVHLIFNDAQGEVPEKVRRVGSTFTLPSPTRRLLEAQAFERIVQRIKKHAQPKPTKDLADDRIDAWRKVVSEELAPSRLTWAESLGVGPAEMQRFLPEGKSLKHVADQLVGFSIDQANELIGEAISRGLHSPDKRIDMEDITDARFKMLAEDFNIQQVKVGRLPEPQGLDAMLAEVALVGKAFALGDLREKDVQPTKLMIVVGPGGTGKSLTAKQVAKILNVPLYTIDFATLFNKYVGESEQNMAKLFELLESLSPCALWIDEIEKALAGTSEGSSTNDGGVSKRMHGQLLSWLQENQHKVFILGTSNNPSELSGPLINRAVVYATGYHDRETLIGIWKTNLNTYTEKHTLTDAQIAKLADMKPSMVGREVEKAVKTARLNALQVDDSGKLIPEVITFEALSEQLESYRTDFETDPDKALFTMDRCSAYKPASGRPLFTPELKGHPGAAAEDAPRSSKPRRRLERDV
jgi:hypothetical protein